MVPFSGWDMPVQYTGIIDEHLHTRSKAGLFDICHMGEFFFTGSTAAADLDKLISCRIADVLPGKCKYGFLLNEEGGIIDDLIVFKRSEDEFMVVVNAGTIEKDRAWIEKHISAETKFMDDSDNIAKIDLQGPFSGSIMKTFVDENLIDNLGRYSFVDTKIDGENVVLGRTGYTGELGYEIFMSNETAEKIWNMLLNKNGVKAVGLGARDTLRLEAGYPLYGNELDEIHTPLEANLERFVYFEKDFLGKEALLKQKTSGIDKRLKGFLCEGRRSARSHFKVLVDAEDVGMVTSGAFSPCMKQAIGMVYVNIEYANSGQDIILTDGNIKIKAVVMDLPVWKRQ